MYIAAIFYNSLIQYDRRKANVVCRVWVSVFAVKHSAHVHAMFCVCVRTRAFMCFKMLNVKFHTSRDIYLTSLLIIVFSHICTLYPMLILKYIILKKSA